MVDLALLMFAALGVGLFLAFCVVPIFFSTG